MGREFFNKLRTCTFRHNGKHGLQRMADAYVKCWFVVERCLQEEKEKCSNASQNWKKVKSLGERIGESKERKCVSRKRFFLKADGRIS